MLTAKLRKSSPIKINKKNHYPRIIASIETLAKAIKGEHLIKSCRVNQSDILIDRTKFMSLPRSFSIKGNKNHTTRHQSISVSSSKHKLNTIAINDSSINYKPMLCYYNFPFFPEIISRLNEPDIPKEEYPLQEIDFRKHIDDYSKKVKISTLTTYKFNSEDTTLVTSKRISEDMINKRKMHSFRSMTGQRMSKSSTCNETIKPFDFMTSEGRKRKKIGKSRFDNNDKDLNNKIIEKNNRIHNELIRLRIRERLTKEHLKPTALIKKSILLLDQDKSFLRFRRFERNVQDLLK